MCGWTKPAASRQTDQRQHSENEADRREESQRWQNHCRQRTAEHRKHSTRRKLDGGNREGKLDRGPSEGFTGKGDKSPDEARGIEARRCRNLDESDAGSTQAILLQRGKTPNVQGPSATRGMQATRLCKTPIVQGPLATNGRQTTSPLLCQTPNVLGPALAA
jgi:hypothetical protein